MSMRLIGLDPYGVPVPGSMCRGDEGGGGGGGGEDVFSGQAAEFAEEQSALNEAVASGGFDSFGGTGGFEEEQRAYNQAVAGPGAGAEREAAFYAPQTAGAPPGAVTSGAGLQVGPTSIMDLARAGLRLGPTAAGGGFIYDAATQGVPAAINQNQGMGLANVFGAGLPGVGGMAADLAEQAGLTVERGEAAARPSPEGDSREILPSQRTQERRGSGAPAAAAPTVASGAQPQFVWDPNQGRWILNPAFQQPAQQVGGTVVAPAGAGQGTVEQATASPQPFGSTARSIIGPVYSEYDPATDTYSGLQQPGMPGRPSQPLLGRNGVPITPGSDPSTERQGSSGAFGTDPALFAAGTAFPGDMTQSLQAKQLQLADVVLNNLYKQSVFQDQQFAQLYGLQGQEDAMAAQATSQALGLQPFTNALVQQGQALTAGGFQATGQDIDLINQATSAALAAGVGDIEELELAAMRNVRDITAPAMGLRGQTSMPRGTQGEVGIADSPIVSQLGNIGESALRQKADLVNRLRAAQLSEILNFPITRGAALSSAIGQQGQLAATAAGQQYDLRNKAIANRLAMTGMTGQLGLGLTGQSPNLGSTISALLGAQSSQNMLNQQQAFQREQNEPSFGERLASAVDIGSGITGLLGGIQKLFG